MKKCIRKRLFALFMCLAMIFAVSASAVGEGLFTKELSDATDEELAQGLEMIKAEQRARIKTTLKLDQETMTIGKGNKQKLSASVLDMESGIKAGSYTWTSSDASVATCKGGVVQAAGGGKAVITCTTVLSNGIELSAQCEVEVVVPVAKVVPAQKSVVLTAGQTESLSVSVEPSNAGVKTLAWESSKPDIATVDENGKLTALKEGKVRITVRATDGSGKSANIAVTVKPRGIVGTWVDSKSDKTILEFKTDGTLKETIYSIDGKDVVAESSFTYKVNGNKITITSISMTVYANGKASTLRNKYTSHGTIKGNTFTWKAMESTQVFNRK